MRSIAQKRADRTRARRFAARTQCKHGHSIAGAERETNLRTYLIRKDRKWKARRCRICLRRFSRDYRVRQTETQEAA